MRNLSPRMTRIRLGRTRNRLTARVAIERDDDVADDAAVGEAERQVCLHRNTQRSPIRPTRVQRHEPAVQEAPGASDDEQPFKLLPGESLAKYVDAKEVDPSDKDEIAPTGDQSRLVGEQAESEPQEIVLSREASGDAEPEESKIPDAPAEEVTEVFDYVATDDELSESTEPDEFDENDEQEDTDNEEEGTSEDSDDEDPGPDLQRELEEAERLAALVEERDGEDDEFPEESQESDGSNHRI